MDFLYFAYQPFETVLWFHQNLNNVQLRTEIRIPIETKEYKL